MGVGGRTLGQELSSLTGIRSSEGAVGQGELDAVVEELLDVDAADLRAVDGLDVDDLDGGVASTVTTSHIVVELLDSADAGNIAELFVHVVDSLTRGVAKPDSVVLDGGGLLLDLVDGKDLTIGSLKLVKLAHEVPEAGARHNSVGREQTHAEHGRVRDSLSGLRATDHNILVILANLSHFYVVQ